MLTLQISQLLGLAGWLFFFICICALVRKLWKRKWTSFAKRLVSTNSRNERGSSKHAPIWFSIFLGAMLVLGATRRPPYPIYEYHNVKVLKYVAANKWMIQREDGTKTLYTGCNDFENAKVIWAGYIARTIRYEDQGDCNSILKPGLGFYWDRDEQANVRRIQ